MIVFSGVLEMCELWNSMNFQCFDFAVIVALVFQRGWVPYGVFGLSLIDYLGDLL